MAGGSMAGVPEMILLFGLHGLVLRLRLDMEGENTGERSVSLMLTVPPSLACTPRLAIWYGLTQCLESRN
jgi:hypothetical protein